MRAKMNRRDVVLGAGALAGASAVAPAGAAAAPGAAPADPRHVLALLRLSGETERTFRRRAGREPAVPVPLPPDTRRPEPVEARVVTKADPAGRPFAYGLAFTCGPRAVNRFTVGGAPLLARRFCFSVDEVCWRPGRGLPVYGAFCPRFEYNPDARYPEAKWHQLVPLVGGRGYFTGCTPADVCEADAPGPVGFDVNDSHSDDNDGYYTVTVWSWS